VSPQEQLKLNVNSLFNLNQQHEKLSLLKVADFGDVTANILSTQSRLLFGSSNTYVNFLSQRKNA
jgi:hypothetical protein